MAVHPNSTITVIGAGVGGLIAAIEAAEAGLSVDLLEARSRLGGRAHSVDQPYVANLGPHALYSSTSLWDWLVKRGLQGRAVMPRSTRMAFRWKGSVGRVPPRATLPLLGFGRVTAPVDEDLLSWATARWGPDTAAILCGIAGPITFDHDPGRLSAAFVVERIQRILLRPVPTARYVVGGWSSLVSALAGRAVELGVNIELGASVDASGVTDLAAKSPVIVAVDPGGARRLLGDDAAPRADRRVALLDIAVEHRRADPYLIIDFDESCFSTRPTAVVRDLAPRGEDLVQLVVGMWPGESLDDAEHRLEALLDPTMPTWRERLTWRRRSAPRESTGAVDLPGTTWRDRPTTTPAPGVWLVGDWVAAPGHLAEVSHNSAIAAVAACRKSMALQVAPGMEFRTSPRRSRRPVRTTARS